MIVIGICQVYIETIHRETVALSCVLRNTSSIITNESNWSIATVLANARHNDSTHSRWRNLVKFFRTPVETMKLYATASLFKFLQDAVGVSSNGFGA